MKKRTFENTEKFFADNWREGLTRTEFAGRLGITTAHLWNLCKMFPELETRFPVTRKPRGGDRDTSNLIPEIQELAHKIRKSKIPLYILANKSGVSSVTLSNWLAGRTIPRVSTLSQVVRTIDKMIK